MLLKLKNKFTIMLTADFFPPVNYGFAGQVYEKKIGKTPASNSKHHASLRTKLFVPQGWLKCEDAACGARTNRMPLIMQRGHPVCPACNRGYLHPEVS